MNYLSLPGIDTDSEYITPRLTRIMKEVMFERVDLANVRITYSISVRVQSTHKLNGVLSCGILNPLLFPFYN